MKLVVGLGNPGREYARTPHNAGFAVVEELAGGQEGRWRASLRFKAHVFEWRLADEPVLLVKPDTFMNRSGEAVSAILGKRGGTAADVLVVVDDADLPLGRLRVRPGGRSGGHRGLDSLIAALGTDAFPRVRVGVGRGTGAGEEGGLVAHVLGRLSPDAQKVFEDAVVRAAAAVRCCLTDGVTSAMNAYNGPATAA